MYRLVILSILFPILFSSCKSHLSFKKYLIRSDALKEANRAFSVKDYRKVISIALYGPLASKDDINTLDWKYELLAKSYYKLDQKDSAFYYVKKGLEIGNIWPEEVIAWQESRIQGSEGYGDYLLPYYPQKPMELYQSYGSISPWILKVYKANRADYIKNVDTLLRNESVIMVNQDQETRKNYLASKSTLNNDLVNEVDSLNHQWLASYVKKHKEWPGIQKRGYHSIKLDLIPQHNDTEEGNLFYLEKIIESAKEGKERWHQVLVIMQDYYQNLTIDFTNHNNIWKGTSKLHFIKHSSSGKINLRKSHVQLVSLAAFLESQHWPRAFFLPKKDLGYTYRSNRKAELVVFQYPGETKEELAKYMNGLNEIYDFMTDEIGVSKDCFSIDKNLYYVKSSEGRRVRYGTKTSVRF